MINIIRDLVDQRFIPVLRRLEVENFGTIADYHFTHNPIKELYFPYVWNISIKDIKDQNHNKVSHLFIQVSDRTHFATVVITDKKRGIQIKEMPTSFQVIESKEFPKSKVMDVYLRVGTFARPIDEMEYWV